MNKVRLAIIGCGGFMRHRLANFHQIPEAEIVALCDPDPKQIRLTVERYPELASARQFSSHQELLKSAPSDAVLIATPHALHKSQILDSFAADRHVLCEKPLVASVAEAHQVMEAQMKSGKIGMVAYQRHFQAEFRLIHDRIASGECGTVQAATALLAQEWKNFTMGTWRQDPALSCGGMLNDSGSHMMDALLWMTRLSVKSVASSQNKRGTPVEINSGLSILFDNGAIGTVTVVGDAQEWHEEMTIWCDSATFYIRNGKLSVIDPSGSKFVAERLPESSSVDKHFIDCVLGRSENESPFVCALRVAELTEAAAKSADAGGVTVSL